LLKRSANTRNVSNVIQPLIRKGLLRKTHHVRGRSLEVTELGWDWIRTHPEGPQMPLPF
jgi:predicted transcriptional regulator